MKTMWLLVALVSVFSLTAVFFSISWWVGALVGAFWWVVLFVAKQFVHKLPPINKNNKKGTPRERLTVWFFTWLFILLAFIPSGRRKKV